MQVIISGKSAQLSPREREYAERKLGRLARYFRDVREAHLTYDVHRNFHRVEVQVDLNGTLLRAERRADTAQAAIDAVADRLEEQVRRLKERLRHHKGRPAAPQVASLLAELPETEPEAAPAHVARVVRTKRHVIRPMTVEEACLQLELLNHDFYIFLNADTSAVNVLYRRHDGDYGVLEVEA
jgi:putative sigma-54 modulation protein